MGFTRTPVAKAAELCCRSWHDPVGLLKYYRQLDEVREWAIKLQQKADRNSMTKVRL